jgi:SAM-dependent methyltransferase
MHKRRKNKEKHMSSHNLLSPASSIPSKTGYIIDAESPAETARLMKQDRMLTWCMGGVFPEGVDLSGSRAILDLACGPGGWALDVAFEYPSIQVTGIDISYTTIAYARARALTQGLHNATFRVMDVTKPLAFPDHHFDLVNARLLVGLLSTEQWLPLLHECVRVTHPGGLIRLTECERSISTSPALEELTALATLALKMDGHSFSPDGHTLGITAVLPRLLREVGCHKIGPMAHVIDYSAGTPIHDSMTDNAMVAWLLTEPFLLKMGVISPEAFRERYQQLFVEMLADDFCALWPFLTIWGTTPLHEEDTPLVRCPMI